MLDILESYRVLRLNRGGSLRPWLGPAVRGLVAARLKSAVCRQPADDQIAVWIRCRGCPLMAGCSYGETFEPDPPPADGAWKWDPPRPIVIDVTFPLPPATSGGILIPVRVVLIGSAATAACAAIWEAVRVAGADPTAGLGRDCLTFDVLSPVGPDPAECRSTVNLPLGPSADYPTVSRLRVELTSPLVLMQSGRDPRRRPVSEPRFGQLIRAGLRTIGPLCRLYGDPLAEVVFARAGNVADPVPTLTADFRRFRQERVSARSGHRAVEGVTGWAEYGPVPGWLVPWLAWAGCLHVGTDRVAGAGGWRTYAGPTGSVQPARGSSVFDG